MNYNQLNESIKKEAEVKAQAEKVLKDSTAPVSVLRVTKGRLTQSEEALHSLHTRYKNSLLQDSIFVLVTGSEKRIKKYAKIAEEDFGCFAVDAEEMYRSFLDTVPSRLYENTSSSSALFEHYVKALSERATKMGVSSHPMLILNSKYKVQLKNKEEAHALLKRATNEHVGAELLAIDSIDKIVSLAVEKDFNQKVCPIVLYTTDEELILEAARDISSRLNLKTFILTLGKEVSSSLVDKATAKIETVNEQSVKESLLEIKKQIKGDE